MKKTERMDKMTLVGEQCRVLKLPAFLEGLHKQEGVPQQAERPFLDRIADLLEALRGYVWVESIHQIPSGRFGNGMRILEQIS